MSRCIYLLVRVYSVVCWNWDWTGLFSGSLLITQMNEPWQRSLVGGGWLSRFTKRPKIMSTTITGAFNARHMQKKKMMVVQMLSILRVHHLFIFIFSCLATCLLCCEPFHPLSASSRPYKDTTALWLRCHYHEQKNYTLTRRLNWIRDIVSFLWLVTCGSSPYSLHHHLFKIMSELQVEKLNTAN